MKSISNCRFTVPWLVLEKSVAKPQKLMHKKRRKNEQVFMDFHTFPFASEKLTLTPFSWPVFESVGFD